MIRVAVPSDAARIIEFQEAMAQETEGISLDHEIVTKGVRAVFENPAKGTYLVAEEQGRVVASLLITFEWSDWRNGQIAWIQSVFVEQDFRGRGIYKSMYEEVQRMGRDKKWRGLRLYVERNNAKAKAVYTRLGMRGDRYEVMEWMNK